MIREVETRLGDWVATIVSPIVASPAVWFDAPGAHAGETGISLYLMEIGEEPHARGAAQGPVQVRLRYLVTAWAPDPGDAHEMLGALLFAARDQPQADIDVDSSAVPPDLWRGLEVPMQPAFVIQAVATRERTSRPVRRVREPLVVHMAPLMALTGRVMVPAPEGAAVPLARAFVELPVLSRTAETDGRGRFVFAGVPGDSQEMHLRIRARGLVREYTLGPGPARGQDPEEPVILLFPMLES